MNSSAPQIGFDRFIRLDWVSTALRIRAGTAELDDLNVLLDAADLGKEAKAKTRTKLNALGLQPRQDLADFAERGVGLLRNEPSIPIAALAWGMAISTYPFFGKVAEITGRLTSIQGVIPPFLERSKSRGQAAKASFCFGVMPPSAMLGRS